MLKKFRRLCDLTAGNRLLFFQLFTFALALRVGLVLVPLPRLVRILSTQVTGFLEGFQIGYKKSDWSRLATLADLAARVARGKGRCLMRSLLLFTLLKTRGEPAELLIGVNKDGTVFQAHAWIQTNGTILGDKAEATAGFSTLLRL
jgi:hypothetical protein